jgi:osmotically-inducible protein OsmY
VPDEAARQRAEEIARSVRGVRNVVNNLRVKALARRAA